MTVYLKDCVSCSGYQIWKDLYYGKGLPRTAQHLLATPAGAYSGGSSNIINVHAPSGGRPLTDPQRTELVKTLLQSSSLKDDTTSVGKDNYIIAGDFNTKELTLS